MDCNEPNATDLKEAGIKKVLENNTSWLSDFNTAIENIPPGFYTGEDIRVMLTKIIGKPKHHNAWGGAIHGALSRNIIVRTDTFQPMKEKKSHARITRVYEKLGSMDEEELPGCTDPK